MLLAWWYHLSFSLLSLQRKIQIHQTKGRFFTCTKGHLGAFLASLDIVRRRFPSSVSGINKPYQQSFSQRMIYAYYNMWDFAGQKGDLYSKPS